MECILPNLDVCPVCEETLISKVASLGKKANEAVVNGAFADQDDEDDGGVDEDDTDIDDDNDDDMLGSDERERHRSATVLTLVSGINAWPRAAAPQE